MLEDATAQTVANWATDISAGPPNETNGLCVPLSAAACQQTVTFEVTNNSNTALFSVQPAMAPNGTLTYTPAPNANGSATVTVRVIDNGGVANGGVDTSASQTFTITVNPVNDVPKFTAGGNQGMAPLVLEDAGAQSVPPWATSYQCRSVERNQWLVLAVPSRGLSADADIPGLELTNNALFSAQPAINPLTGNPTYTPAPNANGAATVTVMLRDSGGAANTGVDTSAAQTFTITVTPVNDAPWFTAGVGQTSLEDAGAQPFIVYLNSLMGLDCRHRRAERIGSGVEALQCQATRQHNAAVRDATSDSAKRHVDLHGGRPTLTGSAIVTLHR